MYYYHLFKLENKVYGTIDLIGWCFPFEKILSSHVFCNTKASVFLI